MAAPTRLTALLAPALLTATLLVPAPSNAAPTAEPAASAAQAQCRRTLAAYPVLRPGDRSAAVRTLQCALNDLGLEVGPVAVDGFYGPQTKAAVREIVNGFEGEPARPYRVNNGFWVLLFGRQLPDSNLGPGAHGGAVTVLQRALRAAGGDLVVDGSYGAQTEKVVRQYQKANDVRQTGVVDEPTRFFLSMGGVIGRLS